MLIRLVKMQFNADFVSEFQENFKTLQPQIAAFEGCSSVQLLQDHQQDNLFFTISHWKDEAHLEAYRCSPLFRDTWAKVKPNFAAKAEAWSLLAP
ncbi:putative quinol monooxygenase [Pedobacter gandavensis]|uniref:Antibiotic biosynthesis monooxygenase n=1 Tax=Pedobacter gandavensis TaxID=2679963 RepID=A0ABR6ETF7_9SPHI|nr:antibiotic biosynthesis monooxygenase family protein [Pedobacter gandavensis]MBB2148548.1 antibiotic biosynthesis monooxygenase [Pedobacter gandavensis]